MAKTAHLNLLKLRFGNCQRFLVKNNLKPICILVSASERHGEKLNYVTLTKNVIINSYEKK